MTIGAADALMIDTNTIVYANVARAPLHNLATGTIRGYERSGVELWTSRQILREYLAVLSRPQTFTEPVPARILVEQVRSFEARFRVAEDGPQVTDRLLTLMQRVAVGGKQVHDANIVATMLVYGVPRLLTANPRDFARFGDLITVLPLEAGA